MNPRITATSVHLVARRSVSSRERLELEAAADAWLVVFPFIHLTLALSRCEMLNPSFWRSQMYIYLIDSQSKRAPLCEAPEASEERPTKIGDERCKIDPPLNTLLVCAGGPSQVQAGRQGCSRALCRRAQLRALFSS